MILFLVAFGIAIILSIYIVYENRKYKKSIIRKCIDNYGKTKEPDFKMDLVRRYYSNFKNSIKHCINDNTHEDLDLDEFFEFSNGCISKIGEQYFYYRLRNPFESLKKLKDFDALVETFSKDSNLRIKLIENLMELTTNNAYYVNEHIFHRDIIKPAWAKFAHILMAFPIIFIILGFFKPTLFIGALLFMVINYCLYNAYKTKINSYIESLNPLAKSIEIFNDLLKLPLNIEISNEVRESVEKLKIVKKSLFIISLDKNNGDSLAALGMMIMEFFLSSLLIEYFKFIKALKFIDNSRENINVMFKYIGYIDYAYSVSSFRKYLPYYSKPNFIEDKLIEGKKLYHPLIKDFVSNDIDIQKKSILITGSNMSGKSTFVRTVGLNLLCAKSMYTCFGEEFNCKNFNLFSAIRISDNLLLSRSYYLEEVKTILDIINFSNEVSPNLILIDELFKGTNTMERLSAAYSVLNYLSNGDNLIFASTHDIELVELLQDKYDLYHFSEVIENNKLSFDYKLKKGPATTRNAIKVLEINNYPKEIINNSYKMFKSLEESKLQINV